MPIMTRTSGGIYKAVSDIYDTQGNAISKVYDTQGNVVFKKESGIYNLKPSGEVQSVKFPGAETKTLDTQYKWISIYSSTSGQLTGREIQGKRLKGTITLSQKGFKNTSTSVVSMSIWLGMISGTGTSSSSSAYGIYDLSGEKYTNAQDSATHSTTFTLDIPINVPTQYIDRQFGMKIRLGGFSRKPTSTVWFYRYVYLNDDLHFE